MKTHHFFTRTFTAVLMLCTSTLNTHAQNDIEGKTVGPVEIRDLSNKPIPLPGLGQTNLLIFYVDPDKPNQNKDFIEGLEQNPLNTSNILSYGVVNMKDAPLMPNGIIRSVLNEKSRETGGSKIYLDPDHSLRDAWGMGDVRNKFVVIFVNKEGKVEFFRHGDFTERDREDFYNVIDKYR